MKNMLLALSLVFSLFVSGCASLLLVGIGGTAGYFIRKGEEVDKEK